MPLMQLPVSDGSCRSDHLRESHLRYRLRIALFGLLALAAASCGQNAAPTAPTSAPKPASTAPSSAQITSALSPIPKPGASPSGAASPAAQGAPVSASAPKQFSAPPAMSIDASKHYTATIDTSM